MRTVAITINKGGGGKTTLTKSIATAATAAGFNVLVLDMDTQQNAAKWGKRRSKTGKPLPLAKFITESDLSEELQRGCSRHSITPISSLPVIPNPYQRIRVDN